MTIYVCQELEQNQVLLPQKQDGSGDNSLCGEWSRSLQPDSRACSVSALSVLVTFVFAVKEVC